MQGSGDNSNSKFLTRHQKAFLLGVLTLVAVGGSQIFGGTPGDHNFFDGLNAWAADITDSPGRYPNTELCADAAPAISFPTSTTISKEYLFMVTCDTPADFNTGDFVSAWISDKEASPILSISEYAKTDTGVVWTSPLSNNRGEAWKHIQLDPALFDCNSSGVPYTINVNWDGEQATQEFKIFCPTISLTYYREEVPYWEKFRIVASVTDNRGYAMRNVPCTASVLDYSFDENFATIKQEHESELTDSSGQVRFEFSTGVLNDLLQGYEYTAAINCMGADKNFTFEITEPFEQNLRNPLYFILVFLSDNAIPIIMAIALCTVAASVIYLIIRKKEN